MIKDINNITATVFDIQPFSIHDGPGIRTTVFLKGCPLHCVWCHNPESNACVPELFYFRSKCQACLSCVDICPQQAITYDRMSNVLCTDRTRCKACGQCVDACRFSARELMGKTMSVREVLDHVLKDAVFFKESGGGVTVSGGEALMQPEFTQALLYACKQEGLHTTLETCGFASEDVIRRVIPYADLILYDLKVMDAQAHQSFTGVSNAQILKNARLIHGELHKEMIIRIPVVPGYNMSDENMEQTGSFIQKALDNRVPVHLLPYHNLGESKKENLERTDSLWIPTPSDAEMNHCKNILEGMGMKVQIGGSM